MKRNKQRNKPNRATRNMVARLSFLSAERNLLRQNIDDQGGTVNGYIDRYGDTGPELYGDDRAALRKVEREYATLTH